MLLVSGECRPALLLYRLYLASLKLCAGGSRQCVGLCRSGYIDQRVSDCACRFGRTPSVIDHGHAAAAEYGCRRSLHAPDNVSLRSLTMLALSRSPPPNSPISDA